ncbi:RcpC/CpaB family pilus assembly protein [Streptomyces litmocidini]|uniref:RcpC/CpaB family pilus assembly protein n=1 Tax=Streptomyces litmocidini TaxID=67318 RepID=UPI0037022CB1
MTTTLSSSVPAPCTVPAFEPLRVRGARHRLRRALRRGRRAPALLLALTAGALAVATTAPGSSREEPLRAAATARAQPPAAVPLVSAPVRIADAATVRLLRPGDRVDVIAATPPTPGGESEARVVARGARVAEVPRPDETRSDGSRADGGALVILSVPRSTAAELAGAGVTSQLAVTVC